jgi:hypothetical protein
VAIHRGKRFEVGMGEAFPKGLVLTGDVEAATEYQSQEDRQRGRDPRPLIDEQTGKRIWKASVMDPDEPKAKRASFEVYVTADVQPVPPTEEVLPGMRPIAFDGLLAEPRVAGQGEFKYLSYQFWATGFADPKASARSSSRSQSGSGSQGKEQAA